MACMQLGRTCHDNVSRTRMATLLSYLMSYFPLIVSDTILCLLRNLKTLWFMIMILYSYVEQFMTTCHVGNYAFILSELFPLDGFRCNFVSAP